MTLTDTEREFMQQAVHTTTHGGKFTFTIDKVMMSRLYHSGCLTYDGEVIYIGLIGFVAAYSEGMMMSQWLRPVCYN